MKKATIIDVAKEAGVSTMSVSRAINNKKGISKETRQRILDIANKLGYRPSGVARSLSTNRTYSVGILVPDITFHFFSHIVRGAEEVASKRGYNLILANTFKDDSREEAALSSLWDKRVDGAILYGSFLPQEQLLNYIDLFQHTVMINCEISETIANRVATINIDDVQGAYIGTNHFIESGCENIAILTAPGISIAGKRRLEGYKQALREASIPLNEELIKHSNLITSSGYDMTMKLLTDFPEVDAILAHNDIIAAGAIRACQDKGSKVPEDISIIGFDDIPLASIFRPSISTLRIGKRDLGKTAMGMLIDLIENQQEAELPNEIITPEFLLRESTKI